ncbi:MAG: BNR-4 repeat-containing protein [Planctomycetota bacterium]|jgi:hypothetical protein
MRRRDFFKTAALAAGAALAQSAEALSTTAARRNPFRLSQHGCGRATGYAETSKIVTLDGKTHVAWLDSAGDGFQVRVRTLDHASGTWSEAFTVGEAYDNHGGPALTLDSDGHLHVVYYPHHHPFRYRRSARANDASRWDDEVQFGKRCTYPTLVCGPDDTLYLTCRESDRELWVVNLYTKRPGESWQGPVAILEAQHRGYAHFQEALAWGPDHRTLHLSCRIYETLDDGKTRRPRVVGYLKSPDFAKTWLRHDGARVELPANAETVSLIADGLEPGGEALRCGSIAVDAADKPHVLFSSSADVSVPAWIATPDGSGAWHRRPIVDELPESLGGWRLGMPGGLTINPDGRRFAVLQAMNPKPNDETWGHASTEIVRLESTGPGEEIAARVASTVDPQCAHWLPNLERPTGHNRVTVPGMIYTAGSPGENNRQILSNEVYWVDPG